MDKNLSIGDAGSLLIGAGLTKLDVLNVGMLLIGVGVVLKITVAVLQKKGVEVSTNNG